MSEPAYKLRPVLVRCCHFTGAVTLPDADEAIDEILRDISDIDVTALRVCLFNDAGVRTQIATFWAKPYGVARRMADAA